MHMSQMKFYIFFRKKSETTHITILEFFVLVMITNIYDEHTKMGLVSFGFRNPFFQSDEALDTLLNVK